MSDIGYGQMQYSDLSTPLSTMLFVIRQQLGLLDTMKLVQVQAVHPGTGSPPAAGTVDVLPLVNQMDGSGNTQPHLTVTGIPFIRLQGGSLGAIICDPQVNDIGITIASDRDISSALRALGQASPGSWRRFDVADSVYIGCVLAVSPSQYLMFTSTGVKLVDKNGNSVTMSSTGMNLTDVNGNQMQMLPGNIINFVCTTLSVNNVPVTVP